MRRSTKVLVGIIVILAVNLISMTVLWWVADRRAAAHASELVIDSARIAGLENELASERGSFRELLESHDDLSDAFRAQGARLDRLEAQSASLTRTLARGMGSGTTTLEVVRVDTIPGEVPDSIAFKIEAPDSALTVEARCSVVNLACAYEWRVQARGALLHQVLPDGRLFVTAESQTEGIELNVETLEWVPPGGVPWFKRPWEVGSVGAAGVVGVGLTVLGQEPTEAALGAAVTYLGGRGLEFVWKWITR